ncbi:hypothetical protein LNN31_13575 [Acetobacterium wieringae]|uniref:CapR homology domain-containing protein n=1 Tax=Acetobacterium wieringae TaxID=52694 RepID=A0ABY6HBE1_9FIRM|nr:hypothetical protein [Acetobacterium wieringae]UYO61806.1 hypothetical protein LNN31_13575 [Acetobacterium wieringae]
MNKKWDINKVKSFVKENSNCELISKEYIRYEDYLEFKCSCGKIFKKRWPKFKDGQRNCPDCGNQRAGKVQSKENDCFAKEVLNLVGDEYTFLEKYKGARSKIKIQHNECGHVYEVTPSAFISKGRRCPKCNGGILKSERSFVSEMVDLYGDEFSLAGEYNGARNNIKIMHTKCGHVFNVTPDNFLHKNSLCPLCSGSKGEKIIAEFLDEKGIQFEVHYSFEDMKRLKYDFAIKTNGELVLIEFDGIQHYEPVNHFGGESKFKTQLIRDKRKTEYCEKNNIRLIRIPYWKVDEIKTILSDIV